MKHYEESSTIELKESPGLKDEIGEAVSAFSNNNGVIGVDDSGKVIGVEIGKKTIEGLANYIRQHTESQVYPEIIVKKELEELKRMV